MPQEYANKLLVAGRMDRDSDPVFVKEGEYTYALNLRPYNTINTSVGTGNNIESCVLVEYDFGLEEGAFIRCVGSRLDVVRSRVYWMVYGEFDSRQQAYVLYYDYQLKQIFTVFNYGNILSFDPDWQITDIDIVYDSEFGDTLLWVGKGEPRKLNVSAGVNRFENYSDTAPFATGEYTFGNYNDNPFQNALLNIPFIAISDTSTYPEYDYTDGSHTNSGAWTQQGINSCYPPFLFETMFYQKPITPYFSPNAAYHYDNSQPSTAVNILEKSYQFCYKFVYFDGQESEWSPKSEAVFPTGLTSLVFSYDTTLVNVEYNNADYIEVRIPVNIIRAVDPTVFSEQPHSMIARVKIAIREVPTKYAPSDWYQIANIAAEDFYRHNVSTAPISSSFPIPNTDGTFYYNWDVLSYYQNTELTRVVTITYQFNGSETLIPIDVQDAQALFYPVPKQAATQELGVNRIMWGSILENMQITKSVYDSIVDNINLSVIENVFTFDVDYEQTGISTFEADDPFGTIISGGERARFTATLDTPYYQVDYESSFYYNIQIVLKISIDNGTVTSLTLSPNGLLSGGLLASGYYDMEEFLEQILGEAVINLLPTLNFDVSFDEPTSKLTMDIIPLNGDVTGIYASIITSSPYSFYGQKDIAPVRTFKNHSQQQIGFVLQDDAGRITPVITGEWGRLNIGHFINDDEEPVLSQIRISSLEDITVPDEAKIIHIVKKRSGSYRDFLQFSISRGNCLRESWNFIAPYYIGFLDLTLDEFDADSFLETPENLYITLNSITGSYGGSYDVLRERANSVGVGLAPSSDRSPRTGFDNSGGVVYGSNRSGVTGDRGEIIVPSINDDSQELNTLYPEDIASRYTPSDGDVVRFLYRMDSSDGIVETYSQLFPIQGYNEKWNTITLNWNDVENKEPQLASYLSANNNSAKTGGLTVRILAEIIKKPTQTENDFYWECAAQLSCSDGSVEINSGSDFIDIFGDVYMKPRGNSIAYNYTTFTPQNFTVLDLNFNDFYKSSNIGDGRPNITVNSVQRLTDYQSETSRGNLIRYSEKSVQNTDIRKYGTVYDANIQELDNAFGSIEQIESEGDKIKIYQEDKYAYAFLERGMTTELSGSSRVISSQNDVISDIVYYPFNGGISKDAATFAKSGYRAYFADSKRGMVYRESMDGIEPISEIGMSGEFKKMFSNIRESRITPILRGVVYDVYNEYILHANYSKMFRVEVFNVISGYCTFTLPDELSDGSRPVYFSQEILYSDVTNSTPYNPKRYPIFGRSGDNITFFHDTSSLEDGDTIAVELLVSQVFVYSERSKGWSFYLSYSAEWAEKGIQSYHTFVDGQMWLHNIENTEYNSFHGRDFDSVIEFVDGDQNTNRWLTVGVKTNQAPYAPSIETSLEMDSEIPIEVFKDKEGSYWGYFLRDSNSVGGLYNGDYLKGRWIRIRLVFGGYEVNEEQLKLFGIAFNREKSDFTV